MVRDGKTCFSIWRENVLLKDSLFFPKGMAKEVRMCIAILDANMALIIGIPSVVADLLKIIARQGSATIN